MKAFGQCFWASMRCLIEAQAVCLYRFCFYDTKALERCAGTVDVASRGLYQKSLCNGRSDIGSSHLMVSVADEQGTSKNRSLVERNSSASCLKI